MKSLNKVELLNKLKDKYNNNWPPEIAEGFQKAVDIVEDTPTVEAITIEWLKERACRFNSPEAKDLIETLCFRYVLNTWREENEQQNS